MSQFFAKLKFLFSSTPIPPAEQLVNTSTTPDPIPVMRSESPTSLPLDELTAIAHAISELSSFQSFGHQLSQLLSTPSFSLEQLHHLLNTSTSLIASERAAIEALSSGSNPSLETSSTLTQLSNYKNLLNEMSGLAPLQPNLDHDTLATSNIVSTVQSLVKYFSVLEKLFEADFYPPELKEQLSTLKTPLTQMSSVFTQFITGFKQFKANEETLRQEILAFTSALEQVQKQNSSSIDWSGRKQAFEQKSAELTTRRAAYEEQESQMNQQILQLCTQITTIYNRLQQLIISSIAVLEQLITTLTIPPTDNSEVASHIALQQQQLSLFITLIENLTHLVSQ